MFPGSQGLAAGGLVRHRYVTNTRVKFVLVVDEPVPKDEEMRMVRCRFSSLLKLCVTGHTGLWNTSSRTASEGMVSIPTWSA